MLVYLMFRFRAQGVIFRLLMGGGYSGFIDFPRFYGISQGLFGKLRFEVPIWDDI